MEAQNASLIKEVERHKAIATALMDEKQAREADYDAARQRGDITCRSLEQGLQSLQREAEATATRCQSQSEAVGQLGPNPALQELRNRLEGLRGRIESSRLASRSLERHPEVTAIPGVRVSQQECQAWEEAA